MQADELQSYVRMYEQSGWMPSFALVWGDWHAMTGNHSAAWLADAWFKGIRNFDLKTAYDRAASCNILEESRPELTKAFQETLSALEARLDEDRKFSAKKLHMELELVKSTDVAALEEQVAELKAALEDEALVIDKLVVYLTRDLRTP